MMIERQIENDIATALAALPELADVQIVKSRSGDKREQGAKTIVSVACGFRANDAFSLSPITLNVAIVAITRTEQDTDCEEQDKIAEAIADLLSRWHKDGEAMSDALTNAKFLAGELRMDGGSARTLDQNSNTWRDTFNFSIRGAERFPDPTTPNP